MNLAPSVLTERRSAPVKSQDKYVPVGRFPRLILPDIDASTRSAETNEQLTNSAE